MLAGVVTGLVDPADQAGPVRPAGREPAAPAGAAAAPAGALDPSLLPDRGRPGRAGHGPAAGRGGRAVRLVRGGTTTSAASGTSTARAARCTRPAVAISSSTPPAFPDFPMPADYPDYPTLVAGPRLPAPATPGTTACTTGSPSTPRSPGPSREGVGWSVTLTNGEFRYYSGIIAAPGTAWHPVGPELCPGRNTSRASSGTRPDTSARPTWPVAGSWSSGAGNSAADIACDAARGRRGVPVGPPWTPVRAPPLRRRADRRPPRRRAEPARPDDAAARPDRAGSRRWSATCGRSACPSRTTRCWPGTRPSTASLLTFLAQGWMQARAEIARAPARRRALRRRHRRAGRPDHRRPPATTGGCPSWRPELYTDARPPRPVT